MLSCFIELLNADSVDPDQTSRFAASDLDLHCFFNVLFIGRYIFVKCGYSIYFYSQFCKSDMSRYGYLEVFQRVHSTSR